MILNNNVCKLTSYRRVTGASEILDHCILELMKLEGSESQSEEFTVLYEAYSKLQDVHILLYEARKKGGL